MRILFLSRWYPYPVDNGSKIRIFNLLKYLAVRHTVDLLSFTGEPVAAASQEAMQQYCQRVAAVPYHPFTPTALKATLGFFSSRPRSLIDTFQPALNDLGQQWHQENRYDLVIASQIDMVPYAVNFKDTRLLFEEVELTTLYEQYSLAPNLWARIRHALTWGKLQNYLRQTLPRFAGYTVVSEGERQRVQHIVPHYQGLSALIANGVDLAPHQPIAESVQPDSLIYAGAMSYQANFDAVAYFLAEIWPLIRAARPQATFYVTGKLDGVPLERLPQREGVVFTGYLDDVRPRVAQSWLSVIPLRQGGGTRLKILEALALGTPIVTTSKGMEGLDLKPERDVLVADTPETFAAAVLQLLRDANLRMALSQNGQRAIQQYDWAAIGANWCQFVEQVAAVN